MSLKTKLKKNTNLPLNEKSGLNSLKVFKYNVEYHAVGAYRIIMMANVQ